MFNDVKILKCEIKKLAQSTKKITFKTNRTTNFIYISRLFKTLKSTNPILETA